MTTSYCLRAEMYPNRVGYSWCYAGDFCLQQTKLCTSRPFSSEHQTSPASPVLSLSLVSPPVTKFQHPSLILIIAVAKTLEKFFVEAYQRGPARSRDRAKNTKTRKAIWLSFEVRSQLALGGMMPSRLASNHRQGSSRMGNPQTDTLLNPSCTICYLHLSISTNVRG